MFYHGVMLHIVLAMGGEALFLVRLARGSRGWAEQSDGIPRYLFACGKNAMCHSAFRLHEERESEESSLNSR